MIECMILGDSIAVGLHKHIPECAAIAHGGWNTWQFNKRYSRVMFETKVAIISLGSNDHQHIKTLHELQLLRFRVLADQVYWILPHGNLAGSQVPIETIQAWVSQVAKEYADVVVPIEHTHGDKIHPTTLGYKTIRKKVNL